MNDTTTAWIILVIAAAVVAIVAVVALRRRARIRSDALRQRFGPEYERVLQEQGDVASSRPARRERAGT